MTEPASVVRRTWVAAGIHGRCRAAIRRLGDDRRCRQVRQGDLSPDEGADLVPKVLLVEVLIGDHGVEANTSD
ncbi:hypothetical protein [Micromonospora thermarum]|uniref:Uncharacterized protein n=1 Tax=Micromonospora thermarum TaxID=2720024 RepID=A0ABX0Z2T1_9ACTN|nr:hypothetical protein [Micromonospora thermarum]NJP32125.1 hypothetical protein [Micromonospora thermarum]